MCWLANDMDFDCYLLVLCSKAKVVGPPALAIDKANIHQVMKEYAF